MIGAASLKLNFAYQEVVTHATNEDSFAITKLYPTMSGYASWESAQWNISNSRTIDTSEHRQHKGISQDSVSKKQRLIIALFLSKGVYININTCIHSNV